MLPYLHQYAQKNNSTATTVEKSKLLSKMLQVQREMQSEDYTLVCNS